MGIWVMSQNGTRLELCDSLSIYRMIDNKDGTYDDIYGKQSINDNTIWTVNELGYYTTKEKAMKVLEMIQGHIEIYSLAKINFKEALNATVNLHYKLTGKEFLNAFDMPQDEEVEV